MISHAYLTLHPSRAFYLKHVYTRNQPQTSRENVRRSRIERYNNRKARSLDVLPISWSQSNCPKLCIHLPLSPKSSKYWPTLDRRDQMNGNAIPWRIFFYRIPLPRRMKNRIAGLDDTAIPDIKIKITERTLEKKSSIPQYRKPPCPPSPSPRNRVFLRWSIAWQQSVMSGRLGPDIKLVTRFSQGNKKNGDAYSRPSRGLAMYSSFNFVHSIFLLH